MSNFKKRINLGSFIFAMVCFLLFYVVSFTGLYEQSLNRIHPLSFVLVLTLVGFVLGIIGIFGIENRKGVARSVVTITLTSGLALFITVILFLGQLVA